MLIQQLIERETSNERGFSAQNAFTSFQPLTLTDMIVAKTSLHGHIVTAPPTISQPCIICLRKGHLSAACPKRFEKKPSTPCSVCGGWHWRMNCPAWRRSTGPSCTHCDETGHDRTDCADRMLWERHRQFWTGQQDPIVQDGSHKISSNIDRIMSYMKGTPAAVQGAPKLSPLAVPEGRDLADSLTGNGGRTIWEPRQKKIRK